MIDFTTAVGTRAMTQLTTEQIVWFTTVGADRAPQPSPVWFLWNGEALLIVSRPDAPKVRNVAGNPRVALNFRGEALVITAEAAVLPAPAHADELAAYTEKYREDIPTVEATPERFFAVYSTVIRVTPLRLRAN